MYAGAAAHLRRVRPDVLLVFTADHYNTFFETMPIFAVGVAESAAATSSATTPTRAPRSATTYEVADEWARVLEQLRTTPGEADFRGRFFDVPAGFSEPKPLQQPYPVVMNAGTSPAGRRFAAQHSDLIFAGLTSLETAPRQIAEIKALARERGRESRSRRRPTCSRWPRPNIASSSVCQPRSARESATYPRE